jgi:nucleotide-binding universal stress UspA family protein
MSGPARVAPVSHVLCWVDGSDEACRAAALSARLADGLGADLSFVAVGEATGRSAAFEEYARVEGVSAPRPSRLRDDVRDCLDLAMSIAARAGVEGTASVIRTGDAAMAICAAARARGADLVVIRRRRSGLVERLLGGSVTEALADGCGFAVLTVG